MTSYEKVQLVQLNDYGESDASDARQFKVELKICEESVNFVLSSQGQVAYQFTVTTKGEFCRAGRLAVVLNLNNAAVKLKFASEKDTESFHRILKGLRAGKCFLASTFNQNGIKKSLRAVQMHTPSFLCKYGSKC